MSLIFRLTPVKRKPVKRFKRETYNAIIDDFLIKGYHIAEVQVDIKNKNHVKKQLLSCIIEKKLQDKILVSVINKKCFLEKY